MKQIALISNFLKQKGLLFSDQAIVSGCNFIMGIVLARFLGINLYGQFVIAWMLVQIFSSIQISVIIDSLFTLSGKRNEMNQVKFIIELSKMNFIYALIGFLFSMLIVYSYGIYTKTDISSFLLTVPSVVFLFILLDFIRKVFMVRKKYLELIIIDFIAYPIQVLCIFELYMYDLLTISNYLIAISVCYSLSIISAIWLNHNILNSFFLFSIQKKTIVEIWIFSRYLIFTSVLQWFSGNYFIVLGATIIGVQAAAIIKIVQNLMGVINILLTVLENFIPYSGSVILKNKGVTWFKLYFKKIYGFGILAILLIIGLVVFKSEYILQLTYGFEFVDQHNVLRLFSFMYVLIFTGTILRLMIKTLECNSSIFYGYVVSTVFSLVFAKSIINTYGLNGVIIGLFATQVISVAIYAVFVQLKLKSYENSSLYTR